MSQRKMTDEEIYELLLSHPHLGRDRLHRQFGVPAFSYNRVYHDHREEIDRLRSNKIQSTPTDSVSVSDNGNKMSISKITNKRVQSLEDLIKVVGVDLTVWDVESWVCNKWEIAAKKEDQNLKFLNGKKTGYSKKFPEMEVQDLWQIKAKFVKNKDKTDLKMLKEEILKEIQNLSPKVDSLHKIQLTNSYLCEIDLMDFHLGKLTWSKETGADYDLKIASSLWDETISRILSKAQSFPIERFLFPVGNDFFNVNGSLAQTFKGTPQSEDSRWKKTFSIGWNLVVNTITKLSQIAPVDIVVIPGNHDFESAFYLGEVLYARFFNNPNVNVDNGPSLRKYYPYGKCLIGFTHGRDEKLTELPLMMATEEPRLFANAKYREWHYGDKHHKKEYVSLSVDEKQGVTLRMIRSLSTTDEWHYQKGYVSNLRAGEAFLWSKEEGLVCSLSANL